MDVRSDRPFPYSLVTASFPEDNLVRAALVSRETYDVAPNGSLRRATEQFPVSPAPTQTRWGTIAGDQFIRKEGVDVCVLGTVRSRHPRAKALISIRVGRFRHGLRISGDRRWERRGLSLVPSPPNAFTEMSLDYAHAFGGTARWGERTAYWAANPDGLGLYLDEEQAEGQLLPNIEEATAPEIVKWDDRPATAGWAPYPFSWGLSLPHCVELTDDKKSISKLRPRLFNTAHPSLIFPTIEAASSIVIDGFEESEFGFSVPADPPRANITTGKTSQSSTAQLDGIYVWPNERKVAFTYRARFQYRFVRHEVRKAVIS